MSVLRLCWRGFIRLTKRQTEGGRKGRKERKGVPARPSLLIMAEGLRETWRPDNCLSSEGCQEAPRHDRGWDENVTGPLFQHQSAIQLDKQPRFFFLCFFPCVPFFLSLRTLQRFKHFILFFLLKQFFLLKSLTWLQPGGLFFFSWIWDNMRV